jgi:prepilin-type processing-associated H-X9-DG protein
VNMSQVTTINGTSNTVLWGEGSIDGMSNNTSSSGWDEGIFSGGYGGTQRSGNLILPDSPGNGGNNNFWGSSHPGGCPFCMCDGSVRLISYSLSGTATFNCALDYRNKTPFNLD